VPLPAGTAMSSVAVGASASLLLGSQVEVSPEQGSALPLLVNTGTGTTTVNASSKLTTSIWSKGNVFLGSNTNVSGGVTTAGTVTRQNGVTVGGTVAEHQILTSTPASWTVTFPSSSTNVVLQPNQVDSRPPGGYATVSIATGAKLTFQSGTYYLDSLNIEPSGQLILTGSGPFVIYVRTALTAKGPFIVPNGSTGPARFVLGFAGTSDVFLQAQLDGTLIAPNANVTLAQISTPYHGAFFGKNVTLQGSVKIQQRGADAGRVVPVAECVVPNADGSYKAVFGYDSLSFLGGQTSIPVGSGNTFGPAPANRGQPTTFKAGRQTAQFSVPFDGKALTWTLDGSSTTANALLPNCVDACVQHLVDPTKPRIDKPLATGAAPLSVDESIAIRTSFRWDDTLPVPQTFSDGSPRLYYALIFLSSPNTLQTLDALRIHYANHPLFEDEMVALEAQGIEDEFSYPHDGKGQFVYALIPGAVWNAVRAAALNPAEPTELFRAVAFRPIPANDSGYATQSSCGLTPVTQCVAQAANGSLRAVFSYNNPSGGAVTVPAGAANAVAGGSGAVTLPEAFATGQHNAVFAVPFASGATVTWTLNGQTVSANAATPRCSATVVSQIGVDQYKPFPAPAPNACRYPTPAEVQNPASALPPAARANTCVSMSYTYASTLGMKWRGVDNDADDEAGQAADAALVLGEDAMAALAASAASAAPVTGGDTTVVTSALFGKLFRKVVKAVAGVAKGAVDLVRKGLQAGAGLFIGSSDVTFTVELQNIDPSFAGTPMLQSWGKAFGKPISLQGVTMRASRSVFLSTKRLEPSAAVDANGIPVNTNQATVNILHHLNGARICFTAQNGAGEIMKGFLPGESCPSGMKVGTGGPFTLRFTSRNLNMIAQMTDARAYMSAIGGLTPARGEVIAGTVANLIGRLNTDRAFAPCFGFSWANDVPTFMTVLGAVAGDQLNQLTDPYIRSGADAIFKGIESGVNAMTDAALKIQAVAVAKVGTAVEGLANTARDAVNNALNLAKEANKQAAVLAQESSDYIDALNTASGLAQAGSDRAEAAKAAVKTALDNVNAQTAVTNAAITAAQTAANQAFDAVAALGNALPALDAELQSVLNVRGTVAALAETTTTLLNIGANVVIKVKDALFVGVGAAIGAFIGHTLGEVFEVFAGGDIIMTAHKSNASLESRGVMTHEYGHFALCNMLNALSPVHFAAAYNEAAALGLISGQSASATAAVMNESFADLMASQVTGGTNYSTPANHLTGGGSMTYCDAATTDCIEANTTNFPGGSSPEFDDMTLRTVGIFTDALDGQIPTLVPANLPWNGNVSSQNGSGITLAATPGVSANDEVVKLGPGALFNWAAHMLWRGPLLREDNVFGGLSDTMIDAGFNWCQRCEVFWLHNQTSAGGANDCPQAWVGSRPSVDLVTSTQPVQCTFEACPTAQQDLTSRICTPTCPAGYHFVPSTLSCQKDIIVR
jgi:hypothetical protein